MTESGASEDRMLQGGQTALLGGVLLLAGYMPSLWFGLPPLRGLLALLVMVLLYVLPGIPTARWALGGTWPVWARLSAGVILGPFLAGAVFFLAAMAGARWLSEVVLLPAGILGAWYAVKDLRREPVRVPCGPALALSALWLVQVVMLFPIFAGDCVEGADGSVFVGHTDTAFHWALAVWSRQEIPAPTPGAPVIPYAYHGFPHYLAGRLAVLTGLAEIDTLARLMKPLLHAGVFLSLALLARTARPGRPWTVVWIAAAVYLLGAPHDALFWIANELDQSVYTHSPLHLGNTHVGHYVIGTSGPFFLLGIGLVLSLVWEAGRASGCVRRSLVLAGVLLGLFQGFAAIFSSTAMLALCAWALGVSLWRRDSVYITALMPGIAVSAVLQGMNGSTEMTIETRLGDPAALYRQALILAALAGWGWGLRALWLLALPVSRSALERDGAGPWYAALLITGWLAGFLVLRITMRNEMHFLNYAGPVASMLAGLVLARLAGQVWSWHGDASPIRSPRWLAVVLVYALLAAPGLMELLVWRPVEGLPMLAFLLVIGGLVAVGLAGTMIIRRPGPARAAFLLLLLVCGFSAFSGNFGHRNWQVSYEVPADLVATARWIRGETEPGERILSLVWRLEGAPVGDERVFALGALSERPVLGEAAKYAGAENVDEFLEARVLLKRLEAGTASAADYRRIMELSRIAGPETPRCLVVGRRDQLAALPGAIVYTNGEWCVADLAMAAQGN